MVGVAAAGPTITLTDQTEVHVKVLNGTYWIDDTGFHIIGEIRNTSSYRINGFVTLRINPGNGGGEQALSDQIGVKNLAPGGKSAFRINEEPFDQTGTNLIEITAGGYTQYSPAAAIGVSANGPLVSDGGGDSIPIQIRNGTTRQVHIFAAIAAFRRSDGKVSNMGTGLQDMIVDPGATLEGTITAPISPDLATRADVDIWARFEDGSNEAVVSWQNWFHDIADQSLRMSIAWLAEQGITGGCATFKYCPTANVTRAQMAIFLVRAFNLPPATGPDHFSDDNGKTGESSINALFESGITGGCKPGLFCPSANVTRAQMAIFLVRALNLPPPLHDHFIDDNGITGESQINSLYEAGVTGGCAPSKFCPKSPVTRAQMAAFLQRALALP
jgi:S-layer homology domain